MTAKTNIGKNAHKRYYTRIRQNILSICIAAVAFLIIAVAVLTETMPDTYDITVGEISSENIYAIAEVEDIEATDAARKKAENAVADVYKPSEELTVSEREYFNKVFDGLYTVSTYGYSLKGAYSGDATVLPSTEKVEGFAENELAFLKTDANRVIVDKVLKVIDFNPTDVANMRTWFLPTLETELLNGISNLNITDVTGRLTSAVDSTAIVNDKELCTLLCEIINDGVTANSIIDEQATKKARQTASENVDAVYIDKGEEVVTKGQVVTKNQYDMLKKMGMVKEGGIFYSLAIGSAGLILLVILVVGAYYTMPGFEDKCTPKNVLLISLLVLLDVVTSLVFKRAGWTMMINTTLSALLIAFLLGTKLAFVINTMLAIVMAMIASTSSDLFGVNAITVLVSSLTGGTSAIIYCKRLKLNSHGKMLLPGMIGSAVSMVATFLVLNTAGKSMENAIISALYAVAGGAVAAVLGTGSVTLWESGFKILTPSKMLELSNTDLIRRISNEIPGTYQHSVAVSEMAEAAASVIGANAPLARTAALYHDIGKIKNPECFTENQTEDSKTFHSTLPPIESAKMIFSHINDGVAIAKENNIPAEIIDVIKQHHGTSTVTYFYNKARNINENTDINDFRYPGPKPKTKEAAIILLADCIEASIRSFDKRDNATIKEQIEKMVSLRISEGELDECELSLKDIKEIKQSFYNTLSAMYHERIKYQGQEKQ